MSAIKKQIGAIFIPVKDVEKSRDWYCKLLGIKPCGDRPFGHLYVIELEGGVNLVLDSKIYKTEQKGTHPLFHFNTDDIQASYHDMSNSGVALLTDIEHEHWFNIQDPDGNIIMICKC